MVLLVLPSHHRLDLPGSKEGFPHLVIESGTLSGKVVAQYKMLHVLPAKCLMFDSGHLNEVMSMTQENSDPLQHFMSSEHVCCPKRWPHSQKYILTANKRPKKWIVCESDPWVCFAQRCLLWLAADVLGSAFLLCSELYIQRGMMWKESSGQNIFDTNLSYPDLFHSPLSFQF